MIRLINRFLRWFVGDVCDACGKMESEYELGGGNTRMRLCHQCYLAHKEIQR